MKSHASKPWRGSEINEAKKVLANAATAILHGEQAAQEAAETARKTFEEGASAEGLPRVSISLPSNVLQACVAAGFAKSNGEARRSIQGGGIKVNDQAVSDEKLELTADMLNGEGSIKFSMGKKRHVLLVPA